uniref:Uncharacterized protein n=1 Tax=Glossina palpalis gambiensis TaxID=67801 RepID=A0A1B0BRW9_9MUSC
MNWPTVRLQWRCCWWQFTSLTIFMLTILMSCISGGRKGIANAQGFHALREKLKIMCLEDLEAKRISGNSEGRRKYRFA